MSISSSFSTQTSPWIKPLAVTGLISKGVVYCLLGILAFMAAFEISGRTDDNADKEGVLQFVQERTGGNIILALLAAGLLAYSLWRLIDGFRESNGESKSIGKRIRYIFSGLIYLSLAAYAFKMLLGGKDSNGNGTQGMVANLLEKPLGQWMVALVAAIIVGVGIYQAYYGISGKYKKHIRRLNVHGAKAAMLLRSGKIGYVARSIVWLLIAFLLFKAALRSNAKEAGDTGNAFYFLESSPYGSYLLGVLALGLICYGLFNFIRAKYDAFR